MSCIKITKAPLRAPATALEQTFPLLRSARCAYRRKTTADIPRGGIAPKPPRLNAPYGGRMMLGLVPTGLFMALFVWSISLASCSAETLFNSGCDRMIT